MSVAEKLAYLNGKHIAILGFGREGRAALTTLAAALPKSRFVLCDKEINTGASEASRAAIAQFANQIDRTAFGESYLEPLTKCEVIIRSPGIPLTLPAIDTAKRLGVMVTSLTRLFFECVEGRVVGVTGTKGKSTTSSLIAHLLRASGASVHLVGNIGVPAITVLDRDAPDAIYIFELSSYQLEDFAGQLAVAVLVNLYPEHLDYHGSLDAYYQAKLHILDGLDGVRPLVVGNYSADLNHRLQGYAGLIYRCPNDQVLLTNDHLRIGSTIDIDLTTSRLIGTHNWFNIACAVQAAFLVGADPAHFAEALRTFRPLEHRLERVGEFQGVTYVNDSIATTPEATIAALRAVLPPVKTLIVGGHDRGYDFAELASEIVNRGVETLLYFAPSGKRIVEAVRAKNVNGRAIQIEEVQSMAGCVEKARERTPSGTTCLLSCASPSYGTFKNFEDRGGQFKQMVTKLHP